MKRNLGTVAFTWLGSLAVSGILTFNCDRAIAQIIPDNTLGNESSVVNPIDQQNERIDGGATRGENLFHSFQEFNVGEGKGVYFANPGGITNILSRVTGGNPSHILGRLGVLGGANLFLLNTNGILFGSNASLDISGSFVATTADGIQLGENGFFSATEPQKSRLLSVSPGVAFFEQAANTPGVIVNRGNLAVGKDLTLSAGNLDLQGQLLAGGNLTLKALDAVKIRDSALNPFVAAAKGDLIVQGNQKVDIFALNHPASGLFSGRDLVLRSANTVGGDAHFWSGGNFRIEQLDGNLGDLYSPHDPVIRSLGDVSFNIYRGASLHILAGGSVNIGTVIITGADAGTEGVDFLQETVQLSNGTEISINGGIQPTVDIRAGIKPEKIGSAGIIGFNSFTDFFINNFFLPETPTLTTSPTSADITIGSVTMTAPDGLIFITNQYQPNNALVGGTIKPGNLATGDFQGQFSGNSGSIVVDSRKNITLTNSFIDSSSNSSDAGSITLIANKAISLTDGALIGNITSGQGNAGDINIQAETLSLNNGASIATGTGETSEGNGGNLTINASESVQLVGGTGDGQNSSSLLTSSLGQGNGGDVTINTRQLLVKDGAFISTSTGETSEGNGGNLTINASESVQLSGTGITNFGQQSSFLTAGTRGKGNAGDITLATRQLLLKDGASISTTTLRDGNAGNLIVNASESVQLSGTGITNFGQQSSFLTAGTGGKGNAGDITLATRQLLLKDGASISTTTLGEGQGGDLNVNASESVQVIGISPFIVRLDNGEEVQLISSLTTGTLGKERAGDLSITTEQLLVKDGAFISTSTGGEGNAGKLTVNASESVQLIGAGTTINGQSPSKLNTKTVGKGKAGELTINTGQLLVQDGAGIVADTISEGEGGNLTVNASDSVQLIGTSRDGETSSNLSTAAGKTGNAGNINLTTRQLLLQDGGVISTSTLGEGSAGNLMINASDSVQLIGTSANGTLSGLLITITLGKGNAGDLNLTTAQLFLQNGAEITTETQGEGNAGNLTVNASELVKLSGFRARDGKPTLLTTETQGSGNAGILNVTTEQLLIEDGASISAATTSSSTGKGGNVNLQTSSLTLINNAQISALSQGQNNAGTITINAKDAIALTNSDITTSSDRASGGAINLTAQDIGLRGDSDIRTNVASGTGGGGDITLSANSILAYDDSDILAFARDGRGGNITLATPVFFGSRFQSAPEGTDPNTLDGNDRVDINASGAVAGAINLPDLTFLQNSITELPENVIDPESLIANSCVVPNRKQAGTFIFTGSGGLPVRPGDASISSYPTGEVRTVPNNESGKDSWQIGDPIVEAQGVYRLPNGRYLMSRQCSR
ncbi:filamentous hemagglutinin family N-terminal domain protein [Pleurocapsa sp. PCC 7327]|uniref:two-partner secretion domain-containing protein n=1 Tax=Pleurocapsa sp. PCC 7327 TaxID=118163 RepID=UPI00029FAABB|nr:filamentous hemagglutinin N-terminal domain-containing protein [Pleurocapsa sp. PCC 7327]AFY78189.1 filamentous hemagglutinin family N-terminal domain protein [Pleurocapsa sp. PCC 7327]